MLALAGFSVFLLNLPFGAWRAGCRRFGARWFLAVHGPIPMVVGLRFAFGLGFAWATYPVLVGAYFAGQLCGSRCRGARRRAAHEQAS
ncbi:MAG: hypothetical protein IPM29_01455 [Planctomycetes bacterium]|nr:hypothetical protein [Planctomycetota bacterium]